MAVIFLSDDDGFGVDSDPDTTDALTVTAVDTTGANQHGSLAWNPDGSYTYTLNNQSPVVQALDEGETLTETYTYTLSDGNGGTDTATLTITINGTNDGPGIKTDSGNPGGAADVVYEAGLASGSGVGTTTTTVAGTFTLSDADGLDDIASVTINGQTIAIADLVGSTIAGAAGTFTVTGYNASTGVASYSYTLTSATSDVADAVESDVFTLSTTDKDGVSSGEASVTIEIVDDVPVAVNEPAASLTEDALISEVSGNVLENDTFGADRPISEVSWDGFSGDDLSDYGDLVQNADGSWSFTLDNDLATTQALDSGESKSATYTYSFIDADGDPASATLTITINGTNDGPGIKTDSGNPGGAADVVYEAGLASGSGVGTTTTTVAGTFTLSDADGLDDIASVTINGQTIAIADLVGSTIAGAAGTFTVTGYNASTGVASYSYTLTSATSDVADAVESDVFTLSTTDKDGVSSGEASVTIEIVDDVPTAVNEGPFALSEDG
ncbi:MAG: VCBS domain-containing protein, partial [Prochlorococcaceae cyanobacterium]